MRPLTFRGYLRAYVRYLSGEDTLALRRLARLSESEPRLVEPLLLWVVKTGRDQQLASLLDPHSSQHEDLQLLASLEHRGELEAALAAEDPRLGVRYHKAWGSYVARRDAHKRDDRLKLAARDRALALEKAKNVSRYRMAKDLGLNPGNLHAFMAQGDPRHISLGRARELVRYIEAA